MRQDELVIPGTQVAFGGFATLLGYASTADITRDSTVRDIYLLGAAYNGLQLARVNLEDIGSYTKYSYFDPQNLNFTNASPDLNITDVGQLYLPGTFSSGSVFYSKTSIEKYI